MHSKTISLQDIKNRVRQLNTWQLEQKDNETDKKYTKRTEKLQELLTYAIRFIFWVKIRQVEFETDFPELNNTKKLKRLERFYYKKK